MDTMNEQLQMDQISRNRMVLDIDSNFFVEAGAGSGKTTMLVNRMVAMVEQGRDISRICAITFTKAAANEFRGRFQKLLLERSNPESVYVDRGYAGQLPPPTEETRERCAYALRNLDLCFMGTIDAFCQMLIAEHPYETGVPSDASVVPDADLDLLYKQEYIRICEGAYGEALAGLAASFHALNQSPELVFVKGMRVFMENKNSTLAFMEERGYVPNTLDDTYRTQIEEIRKLYPGEYTFKGTWERKLSIVLGKLSQMKQNLEQTLKYNHAPEERKQMEVKYEKTTGIYHTLQDLQYNTSMTFLAAAAPKIAEYLRENGVMTYFDYLYYLRNMLREDARQGGELIQYIFRRHSYYLIDEFQDTNPIQSEIFFYLTAEHPVENWQHCDPKPGTLFIVGDPKQSIYRFRNADVGSYLRVKELFAAMPQGDILQLTQNFRSRNKLCQFFNTVFGDEFRESAYQCGFTPIPIVKQEQPEFEGVYSYICRAPKYVNEEMADQYQVPKIIQTLVGNPEFQIQDPDGTGLRPIRYRDIMVIHKSKTNMGTMLAEFERQEIPVRVEGKVRFDECKALRKVFETYKLRANVANCPPAALFYQIMEETPVYNEVEADGMEILYYVLELLRNAENDRRIVTPEDGVAYIESLMQEYAEEERCLSLTEDADCVHMANLHKVKGLEAPVVILAYAYPLRQDPYLHTEYDADGSKTYLFRLEKDSKYPWNNFQKIASFSTDVYGEYHKREHAALDAELTRLIYVAATRARNVLIVSNCEVGTGDNIRYESTWQPLLKKTNENFFYMAGCRAPGYVPEAKSRPETQAADLYKQAEETCILNDRTGETPGYEMVTPSRLELETEVPDMGETYASSQDMQENTEMAGIGKSGGNTEHCHPEAVTREERVFLLTCANGLGTMLHRLMELLVRSKNRMSVADMTTQILEECLPAEYELQREIFAHAVTATAERIRQGGFAQENGVPQDILQTLLTAEEVCTEVPFCYSEKQGDKTVLYNGIMDVVYCEHGNWHIIDYKTNQDGEHLDQKYHAQLDTYIKALKQTTGHEADAKIYHIEV